MQVYLVGGAVRDQLLKLPVTERDWVVVGATPEEMLALGYQPVGKEFPVFLHPETHEEYALARTERKVAKGYKGFTFYAAPDVTLEQDLERRDLTINAIAQAENGTLIDPFGGQKDLKAKLFRHVSPAFSEDPVRILRLARLATKFSDFHVHPTTNQFMQIMVNNGEVNALVAERVWQEFSRALTQAQPQRFFEVLANCGALPILFPEIAINGSGMKALKHAHAKTDNAVIRFSTLLHDIDYHRVTKLCQRLRVPREFSDLAQLTARWFLPYVSIDKADAKTILLLIKSCDALRRPERFENFIQACKYCAPKHPSSERFLHKVHAALSKIDIKSLIEKGLTGQEMANAVEQKQLKAIETFLT